MRRADRRPVAAAGGAAGQASLLGLVRHMAEGEQQWFTMVLGGEQVRWHYYTDDNPDADFDDVDSADVAEAFAT